MSHKLVIYSLIRCPHSSATESTVEKYGLSSDINRISRKDKEHIKRIHGWPSFPQIFFNTNLMPIGGNDSLQSLIRTIQEMI